MGEKPMDLVMKLLVAYDETADDRFEEAAACIREMVEWREGMVLVPRVPTDAMLQGACKSHIPGQSMGTIRGFEHGECPSFERRRRIWADMVSAALQHQEQKHDH